MIFSILLEIVSLIFEVRITLIEVRIKEDLIKKQKLGLFKSDFGSIYPTFEFCPFKPKSTVVDLSITSFS